MCLLPPSLRTCTLPTRSSNCLCWLSHVSIQMPAVQTQWTRCKCTGRLERPPRHPTKLHRSRIRRYSICLHDNSQQQQQSRNYRYDTIIHLRNHTTVQQLSYSEASPSPKESIIISVNCSPATPHREAPMIPDEFPLSIVSSL